MAVKYSKFGLEANQPIDGAGNVAARLQNPDFIANSGAHWLRLNFVLPHMGFIDRYDQIIDRFRNKEMKIYATIGHDATGDFPLGDTLRDPNNAQGAAWIQRYVQRFVEIVNRYKDKVYVFEAFNEPNGWQGGNRAIVHPRWFVYMMNTLYQTLNSRQRGIRLISGPLEATWVNDNEGVSYLDQVYRLGDWAVGEAPWDGIGYHIYVGEDPGAAPGSDGSTRLEDVRSTYADFFNKLWGVVQKYEPNTTKKLWVSEFGWNSILGESFQATQVKVGMDILSQDDNVAMASLFCTEDFTLKYGLYVTGMGRAKQAFNDYRALMTEHAPQRSRVVDFEQIEGVPDIEPPDPGESWPWSVSPGIMNHPVLERGVILLPPFDDGSWVRAVIEAGYHGQGGVTLCWSPGEAGLIIAGEKRTVLVINAVEWGTPDGSMVPWFQQNTPGVGVVEKVFQTPAALTSWLRSTPNIFAGAQ